MNVDFSYSVTKWTRSEHTLRSVRYVRALQHEHWTGRAAFSATHLHLFNVPMLRLKCFKITAETMQYATLLDGGLSTRLLFTETAT